jgi:hypothetical protein
MEDIKVQARKRHYANHADEIKARARQTAKDRRDAERVVKCKELCLPEFLAPYLRVNKCTLALVADDAYKMRELCCVILDNIGAILHNYDEYQHHKRMYDEHGHLILPPRRDQQ